MAAKQRLGTMVGSTLIRRLTRPVPAISLAVVLLAVSMLLTITSQNSGGFDRYYSLILLLNILSAAVLTILVAANLWRLGHQFRHRVLGSRLTLRFLLIFALLTLLPLSVVYYFSIQFLSRGIDSWFDVRIEQALDDALLLGRNSLEATKQDLAEKVRADAASIAATTDSIEVIRLLDELRTQNDYSEMALFSQNGRIIASSNTDASLLLPDRPDESIMAEVQQGRSHTSLEPVSEEILRLRVVLPIFPAEVGSPMRILQVLQPLPLRFSKLGESVQSASVEYEKLKFLRGPLKFSFVLILTLVTLVTALIAMWIAIVSARRLVAPLRDIAEGTRAVAQGNYRKRLPVTSTDEFGVLVRSFNDMTQKIHLAQSQAHRSQIETEGQRTYLETVLSHLSSGVLSFDRDGQLQTHNQAAGQILHIDVSTEKTLTLEDIRAGAPWVDPLLTEIENAMQKKLPEWHSETTLFGKNGRQVLLCRGTRLPDSSRRGGYVVVFDDVTKLIQAQRDAAWGEVARRLAHEIKNPLTPIQLAAERIRRKYLDKLDDDEKQTLDRATRTIGQQVDNMKAMVNAFSNYAQPVQMQTVELNVNRLVQDVIELHRHDEHPLKISAVLDSELPVVNADPLRLRQIFNNLIINTQQALTGQDEPRLTISTKKLTIKPESIEIVVEDNGPGFAPELLDRVFEPYVTSKEKGTGLGLAIVKKNVEEHGGSIRVENASHGGARVSIRIPIEAAQTEISRDSNTVHMENKTPQRVGDKSL